MAIKINFDPSGNPELPTFVLAKKNGDKIGKLSNISGINVRDVLNDCPEISFTVNKYNNGVIYPYWSYIRDLRLCWCKEWDTWFEMRISLEQSSDISKYVTLRRLGESELSQILLHNIEINTETDIDRDDYSPTILHDPENPKTSLLDRILEKAPHYFIKHVDSSIAKIQRTFSFDNISIPDAFNDIADEIHCLFVYDSNSDTDGKLQRTISVYDLESNCLDCGYRGEFTGTCPKCNSENITEGYGEDTTICVSIEDIADELSLEVDVDQVKNCFKLITGDDLMTATIMNCNPNGTDYIWYITPETKEDMSSELVSKLDAYNDLYEYYQNEYSATISSSTLSQYNSLVSKYQTFNPDLETINVPVVGYSALMEAYYNTIDMNLYLDSVLMPDADLDDTSASEEAALLTQQNLSPVAVTSLSYLSQSSAESAVLGMAKVIVDARYQVKVNSSSLSGTIWTGNFTVTNYSDSEDTAISPTISVTINADYQTYVKQKIDKALKNDSDDFVGDIVGLFDLSLSQFQAELKKYCLNSLLSFQDACQGCLDVMTEQGISNPQTEAYSGLYNTMYLPYYNKLSAIQSEIQIRENEISTVNTMQENIINIRNTIQDALDFEKYLGTNLWKEFASFRREDTYENSNYISDGLDNAEIFNNAREFLETAEKELYKSANLQHQISGKLKDLLVINDFRPLVDYFECGNWIRVKIDGGLYKLRILEYEIDFDSLEALNVTFSDVYRISDGISDVKDILDQASSMATSYDTIKHQSSQGANSQKVIKDWVESGFNLTNNKIVNSADNQNIMWDSHGFLCREYNEFTDTYDDKQLKIINKGLFVTNDNWKTSRAGIGNFIYYDPRDGTYKEGYGVIADTIVSNVILSAEVGIYNTDNSVQIDEHGLVITTGEGYTGNTFTIRKQVGSGSNYENQLYVDANGNLTMSGIINASGGVFGGWNISTSSIWRGQNTLGAAGNGNAYFGANGLSISNAFKVDSNGILTTNGLIANNATVTNATITGLTATNANVNGTITTNNLTASGGTIGNWVISNGNLTNGLPFNNGKNTNATGMGTYGSNWAFWAGNGRFSVTQEGLLTTTNMVATGANITGTVRATSFIVEDNVIIYDTETGSLRSALTTTYNNERHLTVGGGFGRIFLGGPEAVSVNIGADGGNTAFVVYGIDPNASLVETFRIDGSGSGVGNGNFVRSYAIRDRTYSSSGNVYITSNGILGQGGSSSKRYKYDIQFLDINKLEKLYDLPIHLFKYNTDYLLADDERYQKQIPGLIAEELDEILPIAVDHLSDGSPEMWNSQILIPCLLKLIQNNKQLIDSLQKEVALLKGGS